MGFLAILQIVLTLLPLLIEVIKAVEQAIPDKGNGQVKQELVNSLVKKALVVDTTVPNEVIPDVMAVVTAQTNDLVAVFNKTGVFAGGCSVG